MSTPIDLHGVDLNLMVTLHVLLEERNVTRAARRLGRTQSSTSHALSRLRDLFDDPLLIRAHGGMLPTPRAEALLPLLGPWLTQARRLLQTEQTFEPAATTRRFSLACPDAIGGALTSLLRWFAAEAPAAHLSLRLPPPRFVERLGNGELDLLVTATSQVDGADIIQRRLGATRFVSFVRAGHPLLETAPTPEAWASTPHVQVRTGDRTPNIIEAMLTHQRLTRNLGLEVPNFMMALAAAATTDAMFTTTDVMAAYAADTFGLTTLEPPIELPEVTIGMFWHRRWQQDRGHAWFRDGVERALRPLANPAGA